MRTNHLTEPQKEKIFSLIQMFKKKPDSFKRKKNKITVIFYVKSRLTGLNCDFTHIFDIDLEGKVSKIVKIKRGGFVN